MQERPTMIQLTDKISTIVLVVFENRSFDHMLGHLKYEGFAPTVDGLETDLSKYKNFYKGGEYVPFPAPDQQLSSDLPHEWNQVAIQLAYSAVTGQYDMTGFVEAYAAMTGTEPVQESDPMGFFKSEKVPITSFLAREFCPCDRWHAPLPTSTQPNRTVAFCGSSQIFDTSSGPRLISCDDILFDWLERAKVRWRVYHDGLSFFALYPRAWKYVLSDNFRDFENYFHDMQVEPIESGPQVIIVEPSYNDAPHIGPDHPNDNHPPLAIGWGEDFLRRAYQAATANPTRWSRTLFVNYYDEHGGFFDHVPPPRIGYQTLGNPSHSFDSLGVRVPGIVASPYVEVGAPCSALFDHTSVLQLLAELFTPGKPYSVEVEERRKQGIRSLSVVVGDKPRTDVPKVPANPILVESALGGGVRLRPVNDLQASFELAASQLMVSNPVEVGKKYPDLFHWKAVVDAERR
jgi:phospholipase C